MDAARHASFVFLLSRFQKCGLECPNISRIFLRLIGTHKNGVLGKNPGKPGGPGPTAERMSNKNLSSVPGPTYSVCRQ